MTITKLRTPLMIQLRVTLFFTDEDAERVDSCLKGEYLQAIEYDIDADEFKCLDPYGDGVISVEGEDAIIVMRA